MKKYIPVLAILLSLSSCIKVEVANLCANAPAAPTLANTKITLASGANLTVNVVSPNSACTYTWINPSGVIFTGSSLHVYYSYYTPLYGNWGVVANRTGDCVSDTTKFSVSLPLPSCGIGIDSFEIAGAAAHKLTFTPNNTYYNYGYYQVIFSDGTGGTLNIYFATFPTTGVYSITSNSYYSLSSSQCTMSYTGGYGYASTAGNVTVNATGSVITMGFCNVSFLNQYNSLYTSGSGYLIGG